MIELMLQYPNFADLQITQIIYERFAILLACATITDGSGLICRTIGRAILFSQVELPAVNRHTRPGSVPMFVSYPGDRL
jgi:hypothetical protein